MKNILASVALSLVAGFSGAYLYDTLKPETTTPLVHTAKDTLRTDLLNQAYLPPTEPRSSKDVPGVDFVKASTVSTNSVVYIKTYASQEYQRYSWFDLFFDRRPGMSERVVSGSGSGVIFSQDGYIVTNNHVIDNANKIEVVYQKKTYEAELIGTDPSTDLALLKVEAHNLPAIQVNSSRNVQVGDWVLAVGNPFNLNSTVTAGIVSAKGRRINILKDIFPIESFIQTDAAINPGNSGGALVNIDGELVGINTAILSRTGTYAGYGFAVPSDIVVKVVEDLKQYGIVQKAFMGVEVSDIDDQLSQELQLQTMNGVVVTNVESGGAGEQIGLEKGDVILFVDGDPIHSQASFDEKLSYYTPGDTVKVIVNRKGKRLNKELVLTNIDGTTGITKRMTFDAEKLGAVFETVPTLERARLNIENGIRVQEVKRGLIYQMGLQKGDIILSINRYKIQSAEELSNILEKIRGRVIVEILTSSGRRKFYSYYF
ncbi:trypsin-like peptidase domain-containing protein [Rapidithrix thailandica]|uniref:Trypsin-like peptidase domain-containing protein n=1 Tax=Rapidithrix thailandica TaxID=413964 RepID=A0AAW9RSS9_9BACT